ncbi:hypothetical protein CEXT_125001 [Caerostris extrusa]|uniref:Uncharacterized protein n=1 Tax=Caerostris extrusa TaxID=172846 RepID=A0AAV4YAU6_CAEEX|nr:hypothetical protein CEXT_125001 [Caerostris extrusa]
MKFMSMDIVRDILSNSERPNEVQPKIKGDMIHGMERQIFEDGYPLRLILRPQQIPLKIALPYSTHPNKTLTHRTNFLAGPAVYWQWPRSPLLSAAQ